MKFVFCCMSIYGRGPQGVLCSLTDYLVNTGNEVTILAMPKNKEDYKLAALDPKVKCIRARLPKKTYGNNIFLNLFSSLIRKSYRVCILSYLKLHKYDVGIAWIEGLATKDGIELPARKKFAWVHCDFSTLHDLAWHNSVYSSISEEGRIYGCYDKVVCVSESARAGVISTIGNMGNLCVKLNPIDWMRIRVKAKETCSISKNASRPLLVAIGALRKSKNFALLLEACNRINGSILFDVWIIGEGDEEQSLKQYVKEHELDNVSFLGFQENPFKFLGQADLFVSTSISESYGLAIQEAFILGIPTIAVGCSGVREVFDEKYGVLIDNSVDELEYAIRDLLLNPDKIQSYRKAIEEHYSVEDLYEGRMKDICALWN